MINKRNEIKAMVIKLRKQGRTLKFLNKKFDIPKSTLSTWFKSVNFTDKQKEKFNYQLFNHQKKHILFMQKKALKWHNQGKEIRLREAENKALDILNSLDIKNLALVELSLAMLYLGEGFKTSNGTGIGNSDPLILKFFLKILVEYFKVGINNIKCSLHLRADQDPEIQKEYWATTLNIPKENFTNPSIDNRTFGRPTYPNYHGVCLVQCGKIAIQRRLLFLSKHFCEKIINTTYKL